ncbi:protein of unknown function [Georgfuchsia toluolica]|uniref:Uncharacterized protein n=1 Tax=Georgfuchsia toluolica TaxID=424218 RepID=A0A916J364_9PROT|nr:hypothetical protein [Georgfuchsia toluolica]CAG4883747.1 protein of unknown function [Georgfuchsia toluolica]
MKSLDDFVNSEPGYKGNIAIRVTRPTGKHGGRMEIADFAPRFKTHGSAIPVATHAFLDRRSTRYVAEQWGYHARTRSMVGLINSAIRLSIRRDRAF